MIICNGWFGRLGNNIQQIANIIDIAIKYKHNVKFSAKSHRFFNISIVETYFNKYNNSKKLTNNFNFFYKSKLALEFGAETFTQNAEERNKLLQKAFLIKTIKKLPEDDLVIHVRSGDLFRVDNKRGHSRYVPPPLSYYVKEINKHNYKKIHIISEDSKNPVINKLLHLYENAFYRKNSLENDIKKILGATNIIWSIGTFIPSLILQN